MHDRHEIIKRGAVLAEIEDCSGHMPVLFPGIIAGMSYCLARLS
jgi:hypothetical protein